MPVRNAIMIEFPIYCLVCSFSPHAGLRLCRLPPAVPLLSAYLPFFFHARGLGFVTGFEEPDSALLPSSGSFWSSSSPWRPQLEVRNKVGFLSSGVDRISARFEARAARSASERCRLGETETSIAGAYRALRAETTRLYW